MSITPPLFTEPAVTRILPCYALTVVVPLIDLDLQVGTTAVWLGSHTSDSQELPPTASLFLPTPQAGSVYIMDYRLWHSGTANSSNRVRPILYIVYSRTWFADVVNFDRQPPIRMSRSQFARVPETYQGLFRRCA